MPSKSKRVRLHKYIANCGYTSRRRAELLIQAGRVRVNDRVADSLGTTIDPRRDRVVINGDEVTPPPRRTVMLHKPAGIITSTHDTHERLTVMDLLPRSFRETGVFPVGRLDQDTEGLLVLTNDGDLHHRIAHPSHEIAKEYVAEVKGFPGDQARERFESGVVIEGRRTAPARVLSLEQHAATTIARVVINEGRKRQVRRMWEALGHPVVSLRRERVGGLVLGELPVGEWREVTAEEIRRMLEEDGESAVRPC